MALGFGFNKTKVLNSAEKFVQQGKLQNAIAEYEKVIKEDPKDLTVLNAIGDLYARVGQNDKASEYFKKVGDQYAQNGFTVKAIAVYKKLTRLSTAADAVIKLAELYTQQGLFNDARTNYMQVADQLLKSGDNNQAAKVFQKILELDPENTTTQSKLADLYIKLGRKEEARNIYYSAAESLYARKAFDAADEALARVLSLEPQNNSALLLRGMIAVESGDAVAAIQYLEQVPDLDSRPDALRALLNGKLQSGAVDGLEALAFKLFNVHQDMSGISAWAEWLGTHHREEEALKLYDQYADRFFAQGPSSLVATLYPVISRIRDNPPALDMMLRLLQKAGDTTHLTEVMELLAHAKVQSGDFARARDLYKELSEAEPENPLHTQNYRQMLAKLGEDAMSRPLTMEESGQALMVEELEHTAPTVHQEYAPTVEKTIEAALTDAELFISYNVPLKAIAPLETVLPVAPRDIRLNQRLASLYVRAGRYADAVRACKVLSELYAEFGHQAEANRYSEEARRCSERAAEQPSSAAQATALPVMEPEPEPEPPVVEDRSAPAIHEAATSTVQEFVLDVPEEFFEAPAKEAAPTPQQETIGPEPTVTEFMVETTPEAPADVAAQAALEEIEIDVSHEWENMLTVEPEPETKEIVSDLPVAAAPQPQVVREEPPPPLIAPPEPAAPKVEVVLAPPAPVAPVKEPAPAAITPVPPPPVVASPQPVIANVETVITPVAPVAPIKETAPAIAPVEPPPPPVIAPPEPVVPKFEAVVTPPTPVAVAPPPAVVSPPVAAIPPEPEPELPAPGPDHAAIEDKIQEIRFYISQGFWDMARAALHDLNEMSPDNFLLDELRAATAAGEAAAAAATVAAAKAPAAVPAPKPAPVVAPPEPPLPVQAHPLEEEFILELEEEPAPTPQAQPPLPVAPSVLPQPAVPVVTSLPPPPAVLAASVPPPVLEPPPVVVSKAQAPENAPEPEEDILGELVSDLEESLGDFVPASAAPAEPQPVRAATPPPAPPEPALVASAVQAAAAAETNGGMHDPEAASVLSNIFSELQQDLGEDTAEAEDPETHYNLGIAFKEMGLLDEAIGELQKVCHSVEVGSSFSQPVQAYTWLAQCLVDKGVPEAAVRWYQKALQLPGLDHSSRCAIYYDLGSALEASGDRKSALANFMEVYSTNIDFRDVADRIKVLKS